MKEKLFNLFESAGEQSAEALDKVFGQPNKH
jgi:hypothetical protein